MNKYILLTLALFVVVGAGCTAVESQTTSTITSPETETSTTDLVESKSLIPQNGAGGQVHTSVEILPAE